MHRYEKQRLVLVRRGADAAQRCMGTSDRYFCRICEHGFRESAIFAALGQGVELTREDVPPKSIGSKLVVLTCRTCNNLCGPSSDVAAGNRAQLFRFVGDGGRAILHLGGHRLDLQVSRHVDGTGDTEILDRSNDPHTVEHVTADLNRLQMTGFSRFLTPGHEVLDPVMSGSFGRPFSGRCDRGWHGCPKALCVSRPWM